MRKKIEELRNREDGFTLIELLAVIVILGLIIAIAIPTVGNVVSDSRKTATEAGTELSKDAARLYFTQNNSSDGATVTEYELQEDGYLDNRGAGDLTEQSQGTIWELQSNGTVEEKEEKEE